MRPTRRALIIGLDSVAAAFAILAAVVSGVGGFVFSIHGTRAGIDALRRRGVTYVSVNCGLHYPGCDALTEAMRRSRALRLIEDTTWEGEPVDLYELVGP